MDFDEFKQDLYDEIAPIFDESKAAFLDVYTKKGAVTYLLGHVNSIGLLLKETSDSERQAKIDRELKEINDYANHAFARLDFLSEYPLPQPKSRNIGTKPKQTDSANNGKQKESNNKNDSANNGTQRESKPRRTSSDQQNEPFVSATSSAAKSQEATASKEPPKASDPIFDAILQQIRMEFAKLKEEHESDKKKASQHGINTDDSCDEDNHQNKYECEAFDWLSRSRKIGAPTGKRSTKCGQIQPKLQLKFNKYELSDFDGDPTKWISFRDEFPSMIDSNDGIEEQLKLQQLKSHCKGAAADALNGFVLYDADYRPSWQVLFNRYNNTHRLIQGYMKAFFELPKLTKEPTAIQFLNMANKTNQLIRVMPIFNYDVSSWDPMLMYNLLSRLDGDSYKKWSDQVKKRELIPLSELLEFLKVQASECLVVPHANIKHDRKMNEPKNKKNIKEKAHVHVAIIDHKCVKCESDEHHTFQCKAFKELPVKERIKCIQRRKIATAVSKCTKKGNALLSHAGSVKNHTTIYCVCSKKKRHSQMRKKRLSLSKSKPIGN